MKTYLMLGLLLLLSGILVLLIVSLYSGQEWTSGSMSGSFTTSTIALPVADDPELNFNTASFEHKPIIISP